MRILLTIAWRNIRENKVKTTIIGLIMVIGIMVLVVGNSLMDTATAGIERYYTKNYTGHLMITGSTRGKLTLFGFQDMTGMEQAVPRIPEYEEVLEFARSLSYVETLNPQVSTTVMVSQDDEILMGTQLFGIIPELYQEMFPDNLELVSGDFWDAGSGGVLLNQRLSDHLEKRHQVSLKPGDKLVFTSVSTHSGMKIREVEVTGIFRFKQSNPQLDMLSLMDVSNVRSLAGMVVGHTTAAELSSEEQLFLGSIDEDSLFDTSDSLFSELEVVDVESDEDYWYSLLGEGGSLDTLNSEDGGAWQYLLVRLRDEKYLKQAQTDFARFFRDNNIAAQTSNWLQGAGALAEMSYGIKRIFNGVVLVIAVVAVIIIMNTLVIAVTERMGEIGTMRAIGAQKGFVRKMVLLETLLLSGLSGLVGIILGAAVLLILNTVGLEASNVFFEIIFGGKVLRPELSFSSVVLSLAVIVIVGVLSSTYPASVVMRTSPLKAMESRGG
ncbi:MAG: ABC transporter permease [Firmicutes bacterium]|nr:ABC transporter permease [Bacillota bacterium]